jgi:hypothetical protein
LQALWPASNALQLGAASELQALPGQMALGADGEWRLCSGRERVPLSYTLQAIKRRC